MYISRLVKTRDLYPGLLQFAIIVPFSFSLPLYFYLFLFIFFFHLYYLIIDLVEVLLHSLTHKGI
jgi:hypothetical protein